MTTLLIIVRHGKPLTEGYANNALYPLSEEGKLNVQNVADQLHNEGIKPEQILTSPLLRAKQSAQILSETFSVDFEEEPALGIDFDHKILLPKIIKGRTTIFVGHEPTLGELANNLIGEVILPNGLSKSCAVILAFQNEVEFGNAQFLKYIKPK